MEVYFPDLVTHETRFPGNSNPQSGTKVVTDPGIYYTHQLIDTRRGTTDAVPYSIVVSNNRVYVKKYYGVLMMNQYQRSAHLIQVDGNCDIVITYDGRGVRPNDRIFLYDPSQTDLTNDAFAFSSNTTSTDPKTLTVTLNMAGRWKFVIDHGQNFLTLDDYEVFVDTSPSPGSTCTNPCNLGGNSLSTAPTFDGSIVCQCQNQYYWSTLEEGCILDCDSIGGNNGLVSGTTDHCQCQGNSDYWNIQDLACHPCLDITHSTGNADGIGCQCNAGYVWEISHSQTCVRDCGAASNAISFQPDNIEKCECSPGFYWSNSVSTCLSCAVDNVNKFFTSIDPIMTPPAVGSIYQMCKCASGIMSWNSVNEDCQIDCSLINDATGSNISPTQCQCNVNYYWDNNLGCLDCTSLSNNDPDGNPIQNQCPCIHGFQWDNTILDCSIDCNLISFAVARISLQVCTCQNGYQWNSTQKICVKECSQNYQILANSPTFCDCDPGFVWNNTQEKCVIDCSVKADTTSLRLMNTSTGQLMQDVCECNAHFYWDHNTLSAVSCTSVQYSSQGSAPQVINICNCINGYQWNTETYLCEISDCTQFSHSSGPIIGNGCECQPLYYWQQSIPQCRAGCSTVNNAIGVHPTDYDKCQCAVSFYWSNINQQCLSCVSDGFSKFNTAIIAATAAPAGLTVYEICSCSLPYLSWDASTEDCILDCSNVINSDGTAVSVTQCQCNPTFYWDSQLGCVDCSNVVRAVTSSSVSNGCNCESSFVWNNQILICAIDWQNIAHATGIVSNTIDQCTCESGFLWNPSSLDCVKECVGPYEIPIQSAIQCGCDTDFVWNNTQEKCVIDCSVKADTTSLRLMNTSTGQLMQDVCECNAHFYWNETTVMANDCSALTHTSQQEPPIIVNECNCELNFQWNSLQNTCEMGTNICSRIKYALSQTVYSSSAGCQCQQEFYWNQQMQLCVRNCSIIEGGYEPKELNQENIDICSCMDQSERDSQKKTNENNNRTDQQQAKVSTELWIGHKYQWDAQTNTCKKKTTSAIILTIQMVPFAATMIFSVYMIVQQFARTAAQAQQILQVVPVQ